MPASIVLTAHQYWDFVLWLVFFLGQCLFILKRAGSAIRSQTNPIKTRRAFLVANWDILLIRTAMEFVFYYVLRHVNSGNLAGFFHIPLPSFIPADSHMPMVGMFFSGYFSDSGLDWVSQWSKLPQWAQKMIKENVPDLQTVIQVTKQTTVTETIKKTEVETPKQ